jgi:hypothetical protein
MMGGTHAPVVVVVVEQGRKLDAAFFKLFATDLVVDPLVLLLFLLLPVALVVPMVPMMLLVPVVLVVPMIPTVLLVFVVPMVLVVPMVPTVLLIPVGLMVRVLAPLLLTGLVTQDNLSDVS